MIFIVGNSRSGTTMMSRILGKNPEVHTFQEIHFFERMVSVDGLKKTITTAQAIDLLNLLIGIQKQGFYHQENLEQYSGLSQAIIADMHPDLLTPVSVYCRFLDHWTQQHGKSIPCEQTPKNLYYINEILSNCTDVKIINMVRDPRSVLLSQKNKWKRRYLGEPEMPLFESLRAWSLYHPITITKLWLSAINTASRITDKNVLTVSYEQFLSNPDKKLHAICDFLGIDFSPDMLNIPQIGSSIGSDKPDQLGIDSSKLQTWQHGDISNTEICIVQNMAASEMAKLGYEQLDIRPNLVSLLAFYISFPAKMAIAILMNLGRMKNIVETLKRRLG